MEKHKIQNKQSQYSDCVHVVEMDDEEFYVPDDVLQEVPNATYKI
jgi:hypothetical protein